MFFERHHEKSARTGESSAPEFFAGRSHAQDVGDFAISRNVAVLQQAFDVFRMTGIEFLYRLLREPRKRWRIQKVLIPYFMRVVEKKFVDLFVSKEGRVDEVRP